LVANTPTSEELSLVSNSSSVSAVQVAQSGKFSGSVPPAFKSWSLISSLNFIPSLIFYVTAHVVGLKLFRLKGQKSTIAVFSLFPNSLQPSAYPPE